MARLGERLAKVPDGATRWSGCSTGAARSRRCSRPRRARTWSPRTPSRKLLGDGILTGQGVTGSARAGAPPAATSPADEQRAHVPGAATEPEPSIAALEQGGVDWFAGPVGPELAVVPSAARTLTSGEASTARPDPSEGSGDWLAPPLRTPPPAVAAPPAPAPRTAPPRPCRPVLLPLPPPGSLPPPPSVAETLARYRVAPRPTAPPVSEPAEPPRASSEADRLVAVPAVPEPERLEPAPSPAPAPTEPAAAEPPEARPAARPAGKSIRERLEPGALPLHLEAPPEGSRPPAAPRRSAVPYLAVGALVIGRARGGAVLLRAQPLDERSQVAAAAPRRPGRAGGRRARGSGSASRGRPPPAPPAAQSVASALPPAGRGARRASRRAPRRDAFPAADVAPGAVAAVVPEGATVAAGEAGPAAAAPKTDQARRGGCSRPRSGSTRPAGTPRRSPTTGAPWRSADRPRPRRPGPRALRREPLGRGHARGRDRHPDGRPATRRRGSSSATSTRARVAPRRRVPPTSASSSSSRRASRRGWSG